MMRNPELRARVTGYVAVAVVVGLGLLLLRAMLPEAVSTAGGAESPPAPTRSWEQPIVEAGGEHSGHDHAHSPGLDEPSHPSPLDADTIQEAADVAARFAVEYASYHYAETPEEREARLAPFLTEQARSWLAGGSTALADLEDQRRRREWTTAEVAYLEPLDVTADSATFLVSLHVTLNNDSGTRVSEAAYELALRAEGYGWRVDHLDV